MNDPKNLETHLKELDESNIDEWQPEGGKIVDEKEFSKVVSLLDQNKSTLIHIASTWEEMHKQLILSGMPHDTAREVMLAFVQRSFNSEPENSES
jgi:hypothetical protein